MDWMVSFVDQVSWWPQCHIQRVLMLVDFATPTAVDWPNGQFAGHLNCPRPWWPLRHSHWMFITCSGWTEWSAHRPGKMSMTSVTTMTHPFLFRGVVDGQYGQFRWSGELVTTITHPSSSHACWFAFPALVGGPKRQFCGLQDDISLPVHVTQSVHDLDDPVTELLWLLTCIPGELGGPKGQFCPSRKHQRHTLWVMLVVSHHGPDEIGVTGKSTCDVRWWSQRHTHWVMLVVSHHGPDEIGVTGRSTCDVSWWLQQHAHWLLRPLGSPHGSDGIGLTGKFTCDASWWSQRHIHWLLAPLGSPDGPDEIGVTGKSTCDVSWWPQRHTHWNRMARGRPRGPVEMDGPTGQFDHHVSCWRRCHTHWILMLLGGPYVQDETGGLAGQFCPSRKLLTTTTHLPSFLDSGDGSTGQFAGQVS